MRRIRIASYFTLFFLAMAALSWAAPWSMEQVSAISPETLHYVFGCGATVSAIFIARRWPSLSNADSLTSAVVAVTAATFAVTLHMWPGILPFPDPETQAATADALSKIAGLGSLLAGLRAGNEGEPHPTLFILKALFTGKDPTELSVEDPG
jgi:hypothetical protein